MVLDTKQAQVKQATTWGSSALEFLRQHPLWGYFLLAFAFTWVWEIPITAIYHQAILGPWMILGPTLAGVIMAGITEGRTGLVRLLRRCIMWRVGFTWYLAVLLFIPAVSLISILAVPGVIPAFQVPSLSWLLTYLALFAIAFFAAFGQEELGWRGFALPRLQVRYGPLLGTLILGSLWGLWHLPVRVFVSGVGSLGVGFLGVGDSLWWFGYIVAFAIVITWAFNHSRGSVFLALLFHASSGATFGIFPVAFFPSLSSQPYMSIAPEIGMIIAAVLIVVATRGGLGYDQYRRETTLPTGPGARQGATSTTALLSQKPFGDAHAPPPAYPNSIAVASEERGEARKMKEQPDAMASSASQPNKSQKLLALCGMIAPVVFAITIFVAGLLRPGYSQIAQTISELGQVGTSNAILQDANFVLFGLLVFPFAVGLHRGVNLGRGSKIGPSLLLLFAVTIILQGTVFPLPLTYQSNPIGAIGHSAAGITGFIAMIFAILVFSRRLKRDSKWQEYASYSLATGVVLIVLLLLVNSQSVLAPWFGLLQRLLLAPYLLWIQVIATRIYALSNQPKP